MKSYSKLQNYLSLFMFITINILFYFKYLSKISIACGAITSVLYILFIIFLFKYKPTFGRKLVNVGIITFIIATSSLLFFIPKEIFTADRWIIIDLFWDSVSNVNLFKVIVYFLYFRFLLYVSTGKFFQEALYSSTPYCSPSFSFISNNSAHFPPDN